MTVRLSVRTAIWRSQVAQLAASVPGLVPVVKGNGYGFGRLRLAGLAAEFADTIAVGNVHELMGLPQACDVVVLTPTLEPLGEHAAAVAPILTVGRIEHLDALNGQPSRMIVKIASRMGRFGVDAETASDLIDEAARRGHTVEGVSIHPPIAGSDEDHVNEVALAVESIDPSHTVWISHVSPAAIAVLPDSHRYRLRIGTALWHGDKSALDLTADVLEVRPVEAGTCAGYHQSTAPDDGHLVVIGAGTANGVTPLSDGRSPFHFARQRLALHEPPHMHVSMVFVPSGEPLPGVGDSVDVQRPLHMTTVDDYRWL
ncbi:MAG: alanine racemase [Ilumatobacter sp.]